MNRTLLINQELEEAKNKLPTWQFESNTLKQSFKFKSFIDAFAFMTKVAFEAEKINHHPDWSNSYNTVKISLTTHSSGGISELDIALASKIDSFYSLSE